MFSAIKGVRHWLHELARIMALQPGQIKEAHQIYFSCTDDLAAANLPETIPGSEVEKHGWKAHKHGNIYRIFRHEATSDIHMQLNKKFIMHPEIRYIYMWSALREIHRHAIGGGGTPIHAALAVHQGKGVLIAASGGTGKSTCCQRFPGYWQVLCDDQVLVLLDPKNRFKVHPFPTWSDCLWREGKNNWPVEQAVPLSAFFFLEQSYKDCIVQMKNQSEAVLSVFRAGRQIWEPYWERISLDSKKTACSLLFQNTSKIASHVPCFRLCATLEGEFWKEMESVLTF